MNEALLLTAGPRSTHNNGKTFEELEAEGWTCVVHLAYLVVKKKPNTQHTRIPGRVLDKFCKPVLSPKNGHPFVKMRPGVHPRNVIEAMINDGV